MTHFNEDEMHSRIEGFFAPQRAAAANLLMRTENLFAVQTVDSDMFRLIVDELNTIESQLWRPLIQI
jgi:hypothetical protein